MICDGPVAIANMLRRLIRERGLRQGDKLPCHDELSRQLGIGIHRLREGLAILGQQGLIGTQRKGGTRIKESTMNMLHEPIRWHLDWMGYTFLDLVRARATIESAIVVEAVRARTARDLLVLLDAIEQMEMIPFTAPDLELEKADEHFHLELLKAAHNPVMQCFGQLIAGQFQRKIKTHMVVHPKVVQRSLAMHRMILRAIEKRDADAARKAMYAHVMSQLQEVARNEKHRGKRQGGLSCRRHGAVVTGVLANKTTNSRKWSKS